jgi:tetratricopeptide (TPR) repeat protein
MFRVGFRIAVVFALLCSVAGAATVDKPRARELFRQGTQHYKLGEYQEALTAFKEAYRNFEEPSFLFNIAQCHRQLGQKQDAMRFYRTYLNDVPEAPNRAEVKTLIASLDAAIKQEAEAKRGEPQGTLSPPPEPERHAMTTQVAAHDNALTASAPEKPAKKPLVKQWWLWTAVGGAVVAVGLGVGLGLTLKPGPSAPAVDSTLGTFHPSF